MGCDFLDNLTLANGVTANCSVSCTMDAIFNSLIQLVTQNVLLKVFQGKHRPTEIEDYEQALRDGPAEIKGVFDYCLANRTQKTQTSTGTLEIDGLLEIYLPTNVSSQMHCAYQLAEIILAILNNEANYRDCGSRPISMTYTVEDDNVDDGILQFVYKLTFMVGMTAGSD